MRFLEIFNDLKAEKNVSLSKIAKETGIPITTLSNYVNRGSIPRCDQLNLLANYFNVSIDYLIGNEDFVVSATQEMQYLTEEEKNLLTQFRCLGKAEKHAVALSCETFYKNSLKNDTTKKYKENKL